MTILYAEDDPDDAMLFKEAVTEVDPSIICVVVDNGKEALNYIAENSLPDLISTGFEYASHGRA